MKEIIILVGISGSSKSTWSTNFIKENPNYLRINRDDIRKTLVGNLDGYYQRKDLNNIEVIINKVEEDVFERIIQNHKNIILDNTNLKYSYISRWIKYLIIRAPEYTFKFKLFDIDFLEAKERVLLRETSGGGVGDYYDTSYIDKQYKDYQEIKKLIETNYKDRMI